MANLTSGQFEKFKPLKMKPEVEQNEKKIFFRVAQVKRNFFPNHYIKSFMVLSYFRLNWAAEIKKLKKSNFGAAESQNYASVSVK